ncbi:hypothetical protein PSN01_01631 [Micromonospora saelicesensis]|nr:hypothetical protein PSN01_01631 [Micromonospora saelicesensis]
MELPIFRELESAWFRTRRPGSEETAAGAQPATNGDSATQQFATVEATGRAVHKTPPGTTGNTPMADTPTVGGAPRDNGSTANEGTRPSLAESLPNRRPQPPQSNGWQTAADDGWRAASAAAGAAPVSETTTTGLPKRKPMAQLVPGAVEKPTTSVQRRSPEAVRGLLSAYHRGVQRGRSTSDNPTSPEATPGGQSSQSGSGPVAGSGQKEQEG